MNKEGFLSKILGQEGMKFSLFDFNNPQAQINSTKNLISENNIQNYSLTKLKDVAEKYCHDLIQKYPIKNNKKQYDEQIFIVRSELRFKNQIQASQPWMLLKTKEQVQKFTKKFGKKELKDQNDSKNLVSNFLQILTKPSQLNVKETQQFQKFIEQSAPHDKWNIKILGQIPIEIVEIQGVTHCITNTFCNACRRSNKYYLTITTQNFIISQHQLIQEQIQQAIPYTNFLQIEYGLPEIIGFIPYNIKLKSSRSKYRIGFHKFHDLVKFAFILNQLKQKTPYFNLKHRFDSFSPQRLNNSVKLFHDGQGYFSDLFEEIQKAQNKICITGWCITPYYLLKRPIQQEANVHTSKYRLDKTLDRAAKRGVKIFIIVFQEPSLFVNNDSQNVFYLFENMDGNFKVLRHPGLIIPQLWSHHEKSVIIDEKIAFMGGLDICYGRWDNHNHQISDQSGYYYGADYNNERQKSITQPRKYDVSNLKRQSQPRMPWHDIALKLHGPAVIDLQRHFVLYWYFALRDLSDDPKDHLRNFYNRYSQVKRNIQQKEKNEKLRIKHQEQQKSLYEKKTVKKQELKILQYTYFAKKKQETQTTSKKDYTFKQRYKIAKRAFKDLIQNRHSSSSKQIFVEGFNDNIRPGKIKMQLCRSSCIWSTGRRNIQTSIYNAYRQLIKESQQFIYIENQFFMSHQNMISEDIAARIQKAYQQNKKFKVIVMMPLLPGFQGDVTQSNAGILRAQMQIQFQAISRDKSSIFQIIQEYNQKNKKDLKISDYISFFGLRNHAKFNSIPQTQIIYVHSKLMIVDDRRMIIGSANINDRSLLGQRDSQLAMVIQDAQGKLGQGQIFDFRCNIFKQHFDLTQLQCKSINQQWESLIKIGIQNSEIYRKIFGCIPDNTVMYYKDVEILQKSANSSLYDKQIKKLKGHYVQWPINFLSKQDLSVKFGQKQAIMPITFFT